MVLTGPAAILNGVFHGRVAPFVVLDDGKGSRPPRALCERHFTLDRTAESRYCRLGNLFIIIRRATCNYLLSVLASWAI
jgi:hypothetical protein